MALAEVRQSVGAATKASEGDGISNAVSSSERRGGGRVMGPTMPSRDDLIIARESAADLRAAETSYKRKRERNEDKERVNDLVGPKETGREGMLEKKKVKRESDRAVRDAKDDPLGDFDDSTLMGGGDSFQARQVISKAVHRCI